MTDHLERIADAWERAVAGRSIAYGDIAELVAAVRRVVPDATNDDILAALTWDAERSFDEVQQAYLDVLITKELAAILKTAGLGRDAELADCLAALGMSRKQLGETACKRVLQRLSWVP